MTNSEDGTTKTIVTFKVSTQEEINIDIENNIKTINLNYTDKVESGTITILASTVRQEVNFVTPSDEEISTPTDEMKIATKEDTIPINPKTSETTSLIIYVLLVISITTSLFLIIKKKTK